MEADRTTPQVTRANTITTKREFLRTFVASGSAQVVTSTVVVLVLARFVIGTWGWFDIAALIIVVALNGPVEWMIHEHILHAPADAWITRQLGLGLGHVQHHGDPLEMRWLMLRVWRLCSIFGRRGFRPTTKRPTVSIR